MTRQEMLDRIGLTDEEFKDLVHKFQAFHNSLNQPQRAAVKRTIPSAAAAAATFGSDVTPEHLGQLVGVHPTDSMFFTHEIGLWAKSK
jgi:hypothetical protein